MRRNITSNLLTKQNILAKVSQVTIFSAFLNISKHRIEWCIETGLFIKSPIRVDDFATCGFRYVNGRLKFKDFAGYFWGDCFDLVALVMSSMYNTTIDISKKEDFIKVLKQITITFKDIFYGEERDISVANEISTSLNNLRNQKTIIEFNTRPWNEYDKKYWNDIGVDLKDLNIEFIFPVDQYYINRSVNPRPKYFYDYKDPCYAYMLGKDKNGVYNIKLYHPNRDKGEVKHITNSNHLEGIYNLDDTGYDIIVINKSRKDTVSLKYVIKKIQFLYGEDTKIGHIGLPHETYRLRQNEFDWMAGKLAEDGVICSVMDNDRAGKLQSIWLEDNYRIIPVLIPKEYKVKDSSEFRHKHGFKKIAPIILNTIKIIKDGTRESARKKHKLSRNIKEGDDMPF